MSCCCNEEEEEPLLQPLTSPNYLHDPSSSSPDVAAEDSRRFQSQTTISPTNSNFSALLCPDTLRSILEKLSLSDLARAACVCRLWNIIASDREIQIGAFKSPWKIDDVIGNPSSGSFWRDNSISKFAISHRVRRGDTVAGLAVRYSVQVVDIKRLNNMMSDHGIYSRERLLIPVKKPELLVNATCYIEMDTCAKREVAILYLEGAPDVKASNVLNRLTTERTRRRLIDSLRRSMNVDDGTAQYYLSVSNGDPRAALSQFSDDLSWERQSTRKVSVRLWWPTCALLSTMLHELLEQGDKGNKLSIGVVVRRCLLIVITQVDMLAGSCLCFVGSSKIFNDVET